MTENNKKNLQDPKKSSIFAPQMDPITQHTYQVVYEEASVVPCEAVTPGEALTIREMFDRTQRGQRLDVHTRMRTDDCPDNMYRLQTDPKTGAPIDPDGETFEHTPPDGMNDIVDVLRHGEEIAERKRNLEEKRKNKTVASAPQLVPAQPEDDKKKKSPAQQPPSEE